MIAGAMRRRVLPLLLLAAACSGRPGDAPPAGPTVLMSDAPPGADAQGAARVPPKRDPAREVEATFGVVRDGPALALVEEVGARVAAASPRREIPYRFGVVDRSEPNAFALPSGHIYVSRGLLALLCAPEELAGVLGHEVAHVAARHVEARERQALAASLLGALAAVAGGFASDARSAALAGPAGQAAAAASVAGFSREQEREADRLGQRYASAAGYAEDGLARALRALDYDRRLREGSSPLPHFFDTHPGGAERFAQARTRAELTEHGAAASAARAEEFLRRLDGLVVGPDPAEGIFRGARFVHAGLDLTLLFPEGWRTLNTPTAVFAVAPEGDAAIALELARPFPNLDATARADLEARGMEALEVDRLRIGDAPALRAIGLAPTVPGSPWGQGNVEALDVTWVERQDGVYRITGRTSEERFRSHSGSFLAAAKSLRRLTPAERTGIPVLRLRLVRSEPDETLRELARRTGTVWTPGEIAVANGLAQDGDLGAPRLLKLALSEPWQPSAGAGSPPAAEPR
jgi:predicted Zn-dependent protease